MSSRHPSANSIVILCLLAMTATPRAANAQGVDLSDRPVSEIRVEGLNQVETQLVLNQVRIEKGGPYDTRVVEQDIVRLTYLNKFSKIDARVEPQDDGSVVLVYVVEEFPLIADVQVVGNKKIPDQRLLSEIQLRAGDPAAIYLIDRAKKRIVAVYKQEGYFDTKVDIDQTMLRETGILLLRIAEGERLRIRAIKFVANKAFTDKQLSSKIMSRAYILLLRKGEFSRDRTQEDADRLRQFYRDRGYHDAMVGREFQISPNGRDVVLTFTVHEGRQYTVAAISITGNEIFSKAQILEAISLRVGDVFSINRKKKSRQDLLDMYGDLGFIEAKVGVPDHVFPDDRPNQVEVHITVEEGKPYWVGKISIKGNDVTKDKVILRQVRDLLPGRPFAGRGIARTERRLNNSVLFEQGRVSIVEGEDDDFRDVLIEVKGKNTGSIGFGAGISSDTGLVGAVDVTQRNFDIADPPENLGEFLTGKAFRGGGQYMRVAIQPGAETSRYSATFREPYLLDSRIFMETSVFFFERERENYDEERIGGTLSFGQRFGDVWSASIPLRIEQIDIGDIEPAAPVDVFEVEGANDLTSLGLSITRNTVDDRVFPTRGSRLRGSISRIGMVGGDLDFTKVSTEFRKFWTVEEDFFERRTVLSARVRVGYIFEDDESPVFERFYAGGHRNLRGFGFRGVGPRGLRNDTGLEGDDPVGGDFLFLFGVEYNVPIYQKTLRGALFIDTGTVQEDISLDEYRASVGAGIRLRVPFLGQAPFALDFAVPVAKESDDEDRLLSFDLAIPF